MDPGGDWMVKCVDNDRISFLTDGATEHMRIESGGKVGINSTSPSERLEVGGDISLNNETNGAISTSETLGSIQFKGTHNLMKTV